MESEKRRREECPPREDPAKQARVEKEARELFDPTDPWGNLPQEIKWILVEAAAALHRGAEVVPGSDLEDVNRSFRDAMRAYIESKGKLLLRGTLGTTARLKLFFSGRWKLLTHLSWEVSFEIIKLNVAAAEETGNFTPFFFLHMPQSEMGFWNIVKQSGSVFVQSLGGKETDILSAATDPITARQKTVRLKIEEGPRKDVMVFGPRLSGAPDTPIEERLASTEVSLGMVTTFDYAIMYGMADTFVYLDVVASSETKESFIANLYGLRRFFFEMIDRGDVQALMGWKNKVVFFSVEFAQILLGEDAWKDLGFWRWDDPGASVTPPEGHPLRREEWGYAFSSYFAMSSSLDVSIGESREEEIEKLWSSIESTKAFVVMPLPWFFFLLPNEGDRHMSLEFGNRVGHKIKWKGMHIVSIPSRQIRTYQPYEMVVITSGARPESLIELMMLQKHSSERARSRMITW